MEIQKYYKAADVFVNPTYEDNYPTTNIEAQACGTPVITYITGGSPESAGRFCCVVDKGNIAKLKEAVGHLDLIKPDTVISKDDMVCNYMKLFNKKEVQPYG